MFANQPTASAGARREGPAMTVEVARAGRRDDRAPRTPAASVDRRAASPWTDAPGPASPAGPFPLSHARRDERDDVEPERRAREADVAAASGSRRAAVVRERVHARGEARAGGEGG